MRLNELKRKVIKSVTDEMYRAVRDGRRDILKLVDVTDDIKVDVQMEGYETSVCVFNRRNLERYYPNIESVITGNLPSWRDVERG